MRENEPVHGAPRVLAAGIALLLASGVAVAQQQAAQQEQQPPPSGAALEEITVTGTRIRRDDFSSPTPTTVVDSEYLDNLGMVNLGQAMAQMPANVNTNNAAVGAGAFGADTNFFAGASFANLRGLNPFFGSRTLTLVDSRRHVPTNQGDSVDLNFIPSILIDRMEVVTGGASASYGSGAIGGVTNILLDRDFEGLRAELDFAETGEGDGDDRHAGIAFGTAIGEGGHFVFGIESQDADSIDDCGLSGREWCARNVGTIQNPSPPFPGAPEEAYWPANGLPQYITRDGLHEAWNSPNGLFWVPGLNGRLPNDPAGGAVPNAQVTPDGLGLMPYDPGVWGDAFFAMRAIGGDGEGIYDETRVRTQVERTTGYAGYTHEINDRLGFFVDVSAGNVESWSPSGGPTTDYYCMQTDYAFIQPELTGGDTTILDFVTAQDGLHFPCLGPGGGVPIKKNWQEQTNYGNRTETDLTRFAFGFNGQFGDSTWTWDAYYQYGKSERVQLVEDLNFVNRWLYGFDAVINPATGRPDCRSNVDPTATTPAAVANVTNLPGILLANPALAEGCAPINVLGTNGLTPEAFAFGWGFLRENTDVKQEMYEFVATGDVAEGFGAGPIRAAAGLSFREESISNVGAEELGILRTDFAIQYGESFAGEVDVWELFGEIDVPFHERFTLNAAARRSDYENTAGRGTPIPGESFSHGITTWKLSGLIDILPSLRLRLTRSRDIRAPNFRELYYGQIFVPGSVFGFFDNPWTNNDQDPVQSALFGGVDVLPEEADTDTIGFVITPQESNIRLALDYYEIKLDRGITPASLAFNAEQCYLGDQTACDRMTGVTTPWQDPSVDHTGAPTGGQDSIPCPATCFINVETQFHTAFNAGAYEVSGLDFTFDWFKDFANGGTLSTRLIGTRTYHQLVRINPALPDVVDLAGLTGNAVSFLSDWAAAPDLTANIIASWSRGNYTVTAQTRWISEGQNSRERIGPDDPAFAPSVPTSINDNTVPSYAVHTLSGSYNLELAGGNNLELFGVIENLLDKDPPFTGTGSGFLGTGSNLGTQPIFFDTLGRRYRLGVRLQF